MKAALWMSVLLLLSCSRGDAIDANRLVGEYELRSPSVGVEPLLTTSDRLRLHDDSSYEHTGVTNGGRQFSQGGAWRVSGRNISLEGWQDFPGVTTRSPRGAGATVNMNCIVEISSPPTIVLDPDRNIFYLRLGAK